VIGMRDGRIAFGEVTSVQQRTQLGSHVPDGEGAQDRLADNRFPANPISEALAVETGILRPSDRKGVIRDLSSDTLDRGRAPRQPPPERAADLVRRDARLCAAWGPRLGGWRAFVSCGASTGRPGRWRRRAPSSRSRSRVPGLE
jgi:hypothetical protein